MKKIFKSGLALMLCFAMVLLSACGSSDSASDAVSEALDSLKSAEISSSALDSSGVELDDSTKEAYEAFMEKLHDFDYEIVREKVSDDGDTAEVKVKLTTYDFGGAYLDTYEELVQNNDVKNISQDLLYGTMFKKMSELKDKKFKKEVTIKCTKNDDDWEAELNGNTEFQNSLFGGTIEIVQELAK